MQTLGSDWRMYTKKGGNTDGRFQPLGQIHWHRVVLDVSACTSQADPTIPNFCSTDIWVYFVWIEYH